MDAQQKPKGRSSLVIGLLKMTLLVFVITGAISVSVQAIKRDDAPGPLYQLYGRKNDFAVFFVGLVPALMLLDSDMRRMGLPAIMAGAGIGLLWSFPDDPLNEGFGLSADGAGTILLENGDKDFPGVAHRLEPYPNNRTGALYEELTRRRREKYRLGSDLTPQLKTALQ